ncbi:MAG: hypothetical protein QXN40_05215 [Candidatus Bathyarchaeia archaeon]
MSYIDEPLEKLGLDSSLFIDDWIKSLADRITKKLTRKKIRGPKMLLCRENGFLFSRIIKGNLSRRHVKPLFACCRALY